MRQNYRYKKFFGLWKKFSGHWRKKLCHGCHKSILRVEYKMFVRMYFWTIIFSEFEWKILSLSANNFWQGFENWILRVQKKILGNFFPEKICECIHFFRLWAKNFSILTKNFTTGLSKFERIFFFEKSTYWGHDFPFVSYYDGRKIWLKNVQKHVKFWSKALSK